MVSQEGRWRTEALTSSSVTVSAYWAHLSTALRIVETGEVQGNAPGLLSLIHLQTVVHRKVLQN